jgi:hypothetical protein
LDRIKSPFGEKGNEYKSLIENLRVKITAKFKYWVNVSKYILWKYVYRFFGRVRIKLDQNVCQWPDIFNAVMNIHVSQSSGLLISVGRLI